MFLQFKATQLYKETSSSDYNYFPLLQLRHQRRDTYAFKYNTNKNNSHQNLKRKK